MNKSFFWTKIGVRACGRGDCNLDNLSSEALIFKRINAQWWPLAAFLYSSISSTSEKKYISGYAYSCRNQSLIGLIYSSPRFQRHHTQQPGHTRIRFFSLLRAGVIYDSPNVSEAVTMDTIQKVTRTAPEFHSGFNLPVMIRFRFVFSAFPPSFSPTEI